MAKAAKKERRRMKKTLRKTLGTLFLISAIVVAAIPVEGLQAADGQLKVTVDSTNCSIPDVDENETIYTTGDGVYQFAYVSPNNASTNNKVAVVLGYNGGYLENGALTIPDALDAYSKYSDNLGTTSGYAAVGQSGNFLFYKVDEPVLDANGEPTYNEVYQTDVDGNFILDDAGNKILVSKTPITTPAWYPCYYEDYDKWKDLAVDQFYYLPEGETDYALTNRAEFQRIQGAEVWYIGNQYLTTGDEAGTWKVAGDIANSSQGIFANQGNIRTLTVGEKLSGIGNYAFYGCSGMNSIKLGNGLDTIGNYAFANCINMTTVTVDLYSRVQVIGDHAFYNCQALQEFSVPVSVTAIGDSAFEECYSMTHIELCGKSVESDTGVNTSLTELGNNVFRNCANLQSLTFPRTFTNNGDAVDVGMFKGCTSLKYISTASNLISFADSADYSFAQFKEDMLDEFYFEGEPNSPVHTMCTENNFAFSHLGKDLYEITILDPNDSSIKAVYRVNSANQLVYTNIDKRMTDVELPQTIGPYKIVEIDSGTFQNNYNLEKVTIPSSITAINENAFKGCYNLEDVVFSEPINVTSIGANAFKTQEVTVRDENGNLPTLDAEPVLNFTGTISYNSAPFQYAMDPSSNINVGSQQRTYITFYSGWPTNLEVQYNPDTDKNELVDYPTFASLNPDTGSKYTTANYAYITEDYQEAAEQAFDKYYNDRQNMTDYEWDIINAALDIVLPEGIESIQSELFAINEQNEDPNVEKIITAYSLNEVAGAEYDTEGNKVSSGAFEGCKNLKAVYLMGATTSIGDYAFEDCEKLDTVYVPTTVTSLGLRPFTGCDSLSYVEFQGSPYFTCEDSIIYALDENGNKYKVIEFLNGRATGVVDPTEMEGITEIADEAFMGSKVSSVDLRSSAITDIPEKAFAETGSLFSVYLPTTCASISKDAFDDSSIQYLEIPASVTYIDSEAFDENVSEQGLTFYCEEGSNAYLFAEKNNIKTSAMPIVRYYTVTFWDYDATLLDTQEVLAGEDAVAPEVPGREGYIHTGWVPDYHAVQDNLQVTAQYEAEDPDAKKYTVTFLDYDGTELKTRLVLPGEDAEPPLDPTREGYRFIGWQPAITNVQSNITTYAQYEKVDSSEYAYTVRFLDYDGTVLHTQQVTPGGDAITPQNPTRDGYTFTGWMPAITGITQDVDTYAQYEKIDSNDSDLTVRFMDYDGTVLNTQKVAPGEDAIIPNEPTREGYRFVGWMPEPIAVTKDLDTVAQYEKIDSNESDYTVRFLDYDGTVLNTQTVAPGEDAIVPLEPTREGYTFTGWQPAVTAVTKDIDAYAQYEKIDSSEMQHTVRFIDYDDTVLYTQKVVNGQDAITPQDPVREGYTFTGWRPAITGVTQDVDTYAQYEKNSSGTGNDGTGSSGTGNNNTGNGGTTNNGTGSSNSATVSTFYTLTVRNGSGSGSYAAGSQPIIIADDPAANQEFDYWSIDPVDAKIASKVLTATVVTMPAGNVTVTAHYKTKTSTTTGSGNSSSNNSSGSTTNRPNNTQGTVTSGGTTVVIDKNGLSNTGVVSATVNGSSDNFTIKITESSEASEAAVKALMAEYGEDFDNIKYFPMDISLYDSTGTKKITDTTGLSVQITIPLPDSLITYAGNNKVASVANNRLEKLTPKFTTISGVPCVTFTAEHFSPYVIYVDTNNLTAGVVTDDTPKTGDGIHPKWFLSIGLACVSMVLFMKKDRRVLQKVRA